MRKLFYCSCLVVFCACNNSPKIDTKAKLEQLADRSCRAIGIRKQRYMLADQIRFTQDTIMQTKNKVESERLQKKLKIYLEQKPKLLRASLLLADTIKRQIDSIFPFTDKIARNKFTSSLDSILVKKGCKN